MLFNVAPVSWILPVARVVSSASSLELRILVSFKGLELMVRFWWRARVALACQLRHLGEGAGWAMFDFCFFASCRVMAGL